MATLKREQSGYANMAREHDQTAEALQAEKLSYTPVYPAMVRVFEDAHGTVTRLQRWSG